MRPFFLAAFSHFTCFSHLTVVSRIVCSRLKASYTLITKYAKTITKCEKWKVYRRVFCVTFFVFCTPFFAFCILQHFAPGSAIARKVKGFHGLFFCGINKTWNSHEIRKVFSQPKEILKRIWQLLAYHYSIIRSESFENFMEISSKIFFNLGKICENLNMTQRNFFF